MSLILGAIVTVAALAWTAVTMLRRGERAITA
jgi:hypothetical protein